MDTKNNPGDFDCYAKAMPDEPMFVLLARDRSAATMVREWAYRRYRSIKRGTSPDSDISKVHDALNCAIKMDQWYHHNVFLKGDHIQEKEILNKDEIMR